MKLPAKGMTLQYIAYVIVEGEVIAQMQQKDNAKEVETWQNALIFYVVGNSPTIDAVERYIASNLNYVTKPKIYYHKDDDFLIKFERVEN